MIDDIIVLGTFKGDHMLGDDGRNYEVNQNYISKSKLVEGDRLKLYIKPDGKFVYKQIDLVGRVRTVGTLTFVDEIPHIIVDEDEPPLKVIQASIRYFNGQEGDSFSIFIPAARDHEWAAIDNIIPKGEHSS